MSAKRPRSPVLHAAVEDDLDLVLVGQRAHEVLGRQVDDVQQGDRQAGVVVLEEPLQGRALQGTREPDRPADPIIVHPDVRRMLLTMRATTEGARALA